MTGTSSDFSQRLGGYSGLNPPLKFKALIFPVIALNCLVSLICWPVIVVFLQGWSILMPLRHVLLQTVINKLFQMSDNLKSYEEAFYDSLKDETVGYCGEDEESQKVKRDVDKKFESLSTKRSNILNLSLLTDRIAPYTVLKNNHLDRLFRNSFLSTRFFLVSSLSMHTGTILTFAGILIGNPNMRTVQNLDQDSPMHCPLQNSTWNGKPCMNCSTFCS